MVQSQGEQSMFIKEMTSGMNMSVSAATANKQLPRKSIVNFTAHDTISSYASSRPRPFHQVSTRRSRIRSRYTMHGHLETSAEQERIAYLPTYRMVSQGPIHMEHVSFIMRNSVLAALDDPTMTVYDPKRAIRCCKELTQDIRFRLKLLRYDRYRIIVMVNIFEKRFQDTLWQMGFLWDIEADQWQSFRHDTKSFTITVVVLAVYWE